MMTFLRSVLMVLLALTLSCVGFNGTADAYPRLQLDIGGGAYDPVNQTVSPTTDQFTLYAFATAKDSFTDRRIINTNRIALSVSLSNPAGLPVGDYGSFSINGQNVAVTGGTFSNQFSVDFEADAQTRRYTSRNRPGAAIFNARRTGMYYDLFDIDMTALDPSLALKFDLHKLAADGRVLFKSPLIYEAKGGGPNGDTPPVPEPATFLLLGSGMAALAAFRKRRGHE